MKKLLHFLIVVVIISHAFGQEPRRIELKDKRTHFSKTWYNPDDHTYTAEISAGYLHYRDENGAYRDIDPALNLTAGASAWTMNKGLFRVQIRDTSGAGKYDVLLELPRPVRRAKKRNPKVKPSAPARLYWKIMDFGYFDRTGKQYSVINQASERKASVNGSVLSYANIFPGVDVRFEIGATRLKEKFVLSQAARNDLPDPRSRGILPGNAFLMFRVALELTPRSMRAFARPRDGRKIPIRQGGRFAFEGEDRIEFEDANENLHFFFPQDFAYAAADSASGFANRSPIRRFFYWERGRNYLLVGVPLSWLDEQSEGDVVIDPTTSASVNEGVFILNFSNQYWLSYHAIGKRGTSSDTSRLLIEFDLSAVPGSATILNSQLKLYYYNAVTTGGTPWVDRRVQTHRIFRDWDQFQATKVKRTNSANWLVNYGKLGADSSSADADSSFESSVLFQKNEYPAWKSWNLTNLTRQWVNDDTSNFGVLLWATNEATDGHELRFKSALSSTNKPKLEITYTEDPLKTVFFLKDHLGSVRATVDDTAGVVGYDDYDPWGYILVNRSSATAWSGGQNVAKNKFTGKEWDDDYSLNWSFHDNRFYLPEIGRWMVIDPESYRGPSLSPYIYSFNNPLKFVDRDGHWPTGIHNMLIQAAVTRVRKKLGDKALPANAVKIFQKASKDVDKDQSQEGSFAHAMRSPDQSVEDAKAQMEDFVEGKLEEALQKTGDDALYAIGEALHPIMDSTSPAHEGFQIWYGFEKPFKSLGHVFQELKITSEKKKVTVEEIVSFLLEYLKKLEEKQKEKDNEDEESQNGNK